MITTPASPRRIPTAQKNSPVRSAGVPAASHRPQTSQRVSSLTSPPTPLSFSYSRPHSSPRLGAKTPSRGRDLHGVNFHSWVITS